MPDAWFGISHLKRARARVHVAWAGREFDALLWPNPAERGELQWATYRNNELVFLPPKSEAKQWSPQPDAWRPLDGTTWLDPLPEPLRIASDRMWTSTMKFALVDDATASDLAREMEADRADAKRGNVEPFSPDRLQWWKDGTLVTYKTAGEIAPRMVEGRLMRAVAACEAGYGLTLESRTVGQALADLATAADRAFNNQDPTSSYGIRFQQLPQDQADFTEAMRWFTELNPPHVWHKDRKPWALNRMQKVLVYRALTVPLSFQDIGNHIGRTGERARQIYKEAVDKAGVTANTKTTVNVEIEKVRERNRQHKRAS